MVGSKQVLLAWITPRESKPCSTRLLPEWTILVWSTNLGTVCDMSDWTSLEASPGLAPLPLANHTPMWIDYLTRRPQLPMSVRRFHHRITIHSPRCAVIDSLFCNVLFIMILESCSDFFQMRFKYFLVVGSWWMKAVINITAVKVNYIVKSDVAISTDPFLN